MNKTEAILNCRFSFKCSQQWEQLKATEDTNRRFCLACERSVYFLNSNEELQKAYAQGLCVAAYIFDPVTASPAMLLGEPESLLCNLYLEPTNSLSVEQLKALQSILAEQMNLLEVKKRFATGQREILRENIPEHAALELLKKAEKVGLSVTVQTLE